MHFRESAAGDDRPAALDAVEVETGPDPRASVIWLHGLGADGHDFEPIIPHLGLAGAVRFVFPHAPVRPVTINNGMRMRAWYDIRGFDMRDQDAEGIAESARAVEALLAREVERGTPPGRIVLAGFSQGGAIALHVALRQPQRLAGLMVLSAYLLHPERLESERHESNQGLPAFVAHGRQDPVVPFALGEAVASALRALGHPVEWHEYPMPHAVCPEEISHIGAWLRGRLAG